MTQSEGSGAEFLSELAHDLRNLLEGLDATVLARPDLELEPGTRDVVHREVLALILRTECQADLMAARAGSVASARDQVTVKELCRQTTRALAPFLRGRDVSLDVPEGAAVRAERATMCRVLASACHALCRETAEGGLVRISLESDAGSHSLLLEGEVSEARRTAQSPQLSSDLEICDEVLKHQGGSVSWRRDGSTSRIVVRMPRSDSGEPAVAEREGGASLRVLVVDDNEDVARSLALLLELNGFVTETAHDGRSALDLAREKHPDTILLDLSLPDVDGFQVCRELREDETTRGIRIVAVSGHGSGDVRRQVEEAGFDEQLLKPVDPEELRRVLA